MPYREHVEPRPDPEPGAAEDLRRRVQRVRVASVVACTAPAVLLTFSAALVMRDARLGFVLFGVRALVVFGSFGIIGSFMAGLFLSQRILRGRLDRWLDEVSKEHGVRREDLIKYTTPWR
jgi:hypothetical protein